MIGQDQKKPCKFFAQGNCKFGARCRDSHDVGPGAGGNFGGGGRGGGGGGSRGMGGGGFNQGGGGFNQSGGGGFNQGGGGFNQGGGGGRGMGGGGFGPGGGGGMGGGGGYISKGGGGGRGFNQGGMNTGGFNQGGMNTGGFNQGGMNTGGFNQGGMNTGGFNAGGGTGGGGFNKPKTICDAFRGGFCKFGDNCKFLHEYSPNLDLNLITKMALTENKESACALHVVEFPVLAVAFGRRVMFFNANNPKENTELQVDGDISCMIVEQKLLAVAYINQNKYSLFIFLN